MTSRDLGSEIALWLAHHPDGADFRTVARGVHARANDVRVLLLDDARFVGPLRSPESPRRFIYRLAAFMASEPLGTVAGSCSLSLPPVPSADGAPLTPGGVTAAAAEGGTPPSPSASRGAVTVVRCLFCEESFEGPAADGIDWSRNHRERQHPDALDRGQRVRERQAKQIGGPVYTAWSGR